MPKNVQICQDNCTLIHTSKVMLAKGTVNFRIRWFRNSESQLPTSIGHVLAEFQKKHFLLYWLCQVLTVEITRKCPWSIPERWGMPDQCFFHGSTASGHGTDRSKYPQSHTCQGILCLFNLVCTYGHENTLKLELKHKKANKKPSDLKRYIESWLSSTLRKL